MPRGGDTKKLQVNALKTSNSSMNPNRPNLSPTTGKKLTHLRTKETINRLKMYKSGGKSIRNKGGKITQAAPFQSKLAEGTMARVQPDRRWFGNTRTIGQTQLEEFRAAMSEQINNPYKVTLKTTKLPMSLLKDNDIKTVGSIKKTAKPSKAVMNSRSNEANFEVYRPKILETEPFDSVFGGKNVRKRPSLTISDIGHLAKAVTELPEEKEVIMSNHEDRYYTNNDNTLKKGQSRRIWGELYKVVDASDIIVHVLDARDPEGTRVRHIEEHIMKEKSHKHILFVLNKCDLVPVWATRRWIQVLSMDHPTVAFHASMTHSFGKSSLLDVLRQFAKLHPDKKQLSVGFIGYPNTGKSSIINTLRGKKVCKVAPIPGETKIWTYIRLFRRMYLIDCPGVVHQSNFSVHATSDDIDEKGVTTTTIGSLEAPIVLRGAVRIETIEAPSLYIPALLERTKPSYITKVYSIDHWESADDLLEQLARKSGRLLAAGEPDIENAAKRMLYDWQKGNIPNFILPSAALLAAANQKAGELGLLDGKMTRMEKDELKKMKKSESKGINNRESVNITQKRSLMGQEEDIEMESHFVTTEEVDWEKIYSNMDDIDAQGIKYEDSSEEELVKWNEIEEEEKEAFNNNETPAEELGQKKPKNFHNVVRDLNLIKKAKRSTAKKAQQEDRGDSDNDNKWANAPAGKKGARHQTNKKKNR